MNRIQQVLAGAAALSLVLTACPGQAPEGLAPAAPAATTVKFDFFAEPLPDIPLPNDLATRHDPTSETGRRINASQVTPTGFNSTVRRLVDQLDGWGVFQTISVPFTGPLDVSSILAGHRDADYAPENDVVYLIDITPESPDFGQWVPLDFGEGNYPHILEKRAYWKHDTRNDTLSLLIDEVSEDRDGDGELDLGGDANGDGVLQPEEFPEDTDADGVLDVANYRPDLPAPQTLAQRADALMTFYESQSHTLLMRPMEPLREKTTYAVVVTRRLLDADGEPVGSPFAYINHTGQNAALAGLEDVLPEGLALDDVAFAFSFTTQTTNSAWLHVREGLYGHGVQAHIGQKFPAEVASLFPLRGDSGYFPHAVNPYVMHTEEWIPAFELINTQLLGADPNKLESKLLIESHNYVDYQVVGTYRSPQLFPRANPEPDDGGEVGDDADPAQWLPYNLQKWPENLHRDPVGLRSEDVHFWLYMPRKEVSARGEGGHVPVVLLGHGYTGNRFDAAQLGGFFAKHGIATIAIDGPSHGLGIDQETRDAAQGLLGLLGMGQSIEAILTDRSHDQNFDGVPDSGADFWSAYLFHTRDVVRQFALDYMQLVRVIRAFDGTQTWGIDVDGDGEGDLAGDFDGDGQVDIGKDSIIGMVGASLGGMMATYVAGLEPELDAIFPIAAGGGLGEIGVRSQQGGVREAFILRALGPLFVGTLDAETGTTTLETIVPDLNDTAERAFGTTDQIAPGDVVRVRNLENGELGCANVQPDGSFRLGLECDTFDRIELEVFDGPVLNGDTHCGVIDGAAPKATVNTFEVEVSFQGQTYAAGETLVALQEGFGMQRGSPDLRRLFGIGQLVIDAADPAVAARHIQREPLHYPNLDQKTGAHTMLITTMGDMSVPASSGMSIARAGGWLDYRQADPRYGMPPNQVLLDHFAAESVHNIGRYLNDAGDPVHIDLENLAEGTHPWAGQGIPVLDPPLRLYGEDDLCDEDGCGFSGALFPWPHPTGQHGFDFPGSWVDKGRAACAASCEETEGEDPCGCATLEVFDIGSYLFNMAGRFLGSGGKLLETDRCLSRGDCAWIAEAPAARPLTDLP